MFIGAFCGGGSLNGGFGACVHVMCRFGISKIHNRNRNCNCIPICTIVKALEHWVSCGGVEVRGREGERERGVCIYIYIIIIRFVGWMPVLSYE